MFYSLTGNIVFVDTQSIAVECGGIAFRCFTSLQTLKKTGRTGTRATLYTHLAVREDAAELYGFADARELELFKILIGVSGVGPKAAIAILSELDPDRLALAIASGDVKSITRAQGVGPKIAQRLVLELKDKIGKGMPAGLSAAELEGVAAIAVQGSASEAVSALTVLGYSQSDAARAVSKLDPKLSVEELVRLALRSLTRGM